MKLDCNDCKMKLKDCSAFNIVETTNKIKNTRRIVRNRNKMKLEEIISSSSDLNENCPR